MFLAELLVAALPLKSLHAFTLAAFLLHKLLENILQFKLKKISHCSCYWQLCC